MKLTRVVVASALIAGGAAVGLADPANAADSNALGTYTFEADGGESATWTLTPCIDDSDQCVHVAASGSSKHGPWSADAHWTVGSWILFVDQPDAVSCPSGGSAGGLNNYSWDASTLTGYASIFTGACGGDPESLAIPFTLTKTGSPVVAPTAPIYDQPFYPPTAEVYEPGPTAEAPPAGPIETDPALTATPAEIPNLSDPLTEAEVAMPGFNAEPGGDKSGGGGRGGGGR
jgi:hypothetical protein